MSTRAASILGGTFGGGWGGLLSGAVEDIDALGLSFHKIRILHYTSAGRINASAIAERLRNNGHTIAPRSLNHLLLAMARDGWITSKSPRRDSNALPCYSISGEGRAVLNQARESLKVLGELLFFPRQRAS